MPSVSILYHFFPPDDVVSAELNGDLARGLAAKGWDVTVLTSNRYCHDSEAEIESLEEEWNGVKVIRMPRSPRDQGTFRGKILNSFEIQRTWLKRLESLPEPDALVLGTDPQFSQFLLPGLRKRLTRTRLVLWAFDLYPEILAVAGNPVIALGAKSLKALMPRFYRPLDHIVDIGPCMRKRLSAHAPEAKRETIPPWALVELDSPAQPAPAIREKLFGNARLGILYSGSIGRAHGFERFVELARKLRDRGSSVVFCFAGRGHRHDQLKTLVSSDDTNIRFAGFCSREELEQRLLSADLHMISLRGGWEGTVVPSKFFAALAVAKPVIYDGAADSDIGIWIRELEVGIRLDDPTLDETADQLTQLAENQEALNQWQARALKSYHEHFSREKAIERWGGVLHSGIRD